MLGTVKKHLRLKVHAEYEPDQRTDNSGVPRDRKMKI